MNKSESYLRCQCMFNSAVGLTKMLGRKRSEMEPEDNLFDTIMALPDSYQVHENVYHEDSRIYDIMEEDEKLGSFAEYRRSLSGKIYSMLMLDYRIPY